MTNIEREALEEIRKYIAVVTAALDSLSAYVDAIPPSPSCTSKTNPLSTKPSKTERSPTTGDLLPAKNEPYSHSVLYYKPDCRFPSSGRREEARANGFITVNEFIEEINLSSTWLFYFIKNQPETNDIDFRGGTILVNKNLLIERLSKTPLWQQRQKTGRLFFGSK